MGKVASACRPYPFNLVKFERSLVSVAVTLSMNSLCIEVNICCLALWWSHSLTEERKKKRKKKTKKKKKKEEEEEFIYVHRGPGEIVRCCREEPWSKILRSLDFWLTESVGSFPI